VVKERDSDRNKKKELGPAECKLAEALLLAKLIGRLVLLE
jgi:hypothetical protein